MKIGILAEATGTPVETIRFYEREGLLPPPARAENNYRMYLPVHVERLAFVRQCRNLDMTLDEIRALPASLSGDGLRRDGGGGRHGISGWYKEHRSCSGKLNSR